MEKGDLITVILACAVVAIGAFAFGLGTGTPAQAPGEAGPQPTAAGMLLPTPTATPALQPYRIFYDKDYFSFPRYIFPENMDVYGGSLLGWDTPDSVVFAFMEESTGGVSQIFVVPYPVWRINCTVSAGPNPAGTRFRMMLVNLKTGSIIRGAELLGSGTVYKAVQVQNTEVYLVIGLQDVKHYRIQLETLPRYL